MSTQDVPTVFIVDDDRDVRESLQELLESVGLPSKSFGTVQEFLSSPRSDGPSCLILDVRLPGISGMDCLWSPTGSRRSCWKYASVLLRSR